MGLPKVAGLLKVRADRDASAGAARTESGELQRAVHTVAQARGIPSSHRRDAVRTLSEDRAVTLLARLISREEGFGIPGALPTRDHNPGDLRHSPHSAHPL